jgi:glutamate synthase domain-containing protein 2
MPVSSIALQMPKNSQGCPTLCAVGFYDLAQTRHSIRRNYPILANFRFFFETIRPEIRQYLVESDTDAVPFSRTQRSLVYQRAKNVEDKRPFGTELDVSVAGYEWINHSMRPVKIARIALADSEPKLIAEMLSSEEALRPEPPPAASAARRDSQPRRSHRS